MDAAVAGAAAVGVGMAVALGAAMATRRRGGAQGERSSQDEAVRAVGGESPEAARLVGRFLEREEEGAVVLMASHMGSRLHGTSTPQSDTDIQVLFTPSLDRLALRRAVHQSTLSPPGKNDSSSVDVSILSLQEALQRVCKFDMNAFELLCSLDAGSVLFAHPAVAHITLALPSMVTRGLLSKILGFVSGHMKRQQNKPGLDERQRFKSLAHALRALRQAEEILTTGRIRYPLACADELLEVKTGTLPMEGVLARIAVRRGLGRRRRWRRGWRRSVAVAAAGGPGPTLPLAHLPRLQEGEARVRDLLQGERAFASPEDAEAVADEVAMRVLREVGVMR